MEKFSFDNYAIRGLIYLRKLIFCVLNEDNHNYLGFDFLIKNSFQPSYLGRRFPNKPISKWTQSFRVNLLGIKVTKKAVIVITIFLKQSL